MSELTPCPGCRRHVRSRETSCPFCGVAVSLAHLPAQPLPRSRLGRAATFAFGTTLVSATALAACGGETEGKRGGEAGTAAAGAASGGKADGGALSGAAAAALGGGLTIVPPYGAPPEPSGGSPGGIGCIDLSGGATAAGSGDTGGCFIGISK